MGLWHKKIHTLLVLGILIIGVVVTTILVQNHVIFFQHAAAPENPENIRVTNLSDSAFTLTYTTAQPVIGTLSVYKDGQTPQTVFDDRDQQRGVPKMYTIHSLTVKNLDPNTTYHVKIISGQTTYLNGDVPFDITTANTLSSSPINQPPLAGKVILPSGSSPADAIIFVTTDNGQLLSTLLQPSGLYIVPLNTFRTKDFSSFVLLSSQTTIHLLLTDGNLTSHANVSLASSNPIPTITLSYDYDFTLGKNPVKNEKFTDQQPQFSGTALPNQQVQITIHSSDAISTSVIANGQGSWSYRPAQKLTPGQHTITITTVNQYGILQTIQQAFTVYASGSQVDQTATPSATLAPTSTPTPTPTIIVTKIPTPTIGITNTVTMTIPPTTTTIITKAPTRAQLPPTGNNTVVIAGAAGIATTLIGIVLFLLTHGATL